jgi:archaea-specific DNA-binding protein
MNSRPDNTVFVGNKPVMNYVLACLTLFQNGTTEVSLKARGRAISRAVDTAEILSNRYGPDVSVKKIDIGTEQVNDTDSGGMTNVSSMEIYLSSSSELNN